MRRSRWFAHAGYLCVLTWIQLYIAREFFVREYTGYMNSMHGFWIAIARLAGDGWFRPLWWPYWDAGMPFEYTYAPLVPFAAAAWSTLAGVSPAAAFQAVSGVVYCSAPIALYLFAFVLTRSPGYSFVAAAAYSLLAPSELVVPDASFDWRHVLDARRFYLTAVWDETPHVAALSFCLLAIAFLARAVERRSAAWWMAASLSMAGAALANLFGAAVLAILTACFLAAWGPGQWRRTAWMALSAGAAAWLISSPFLSPSFLRTVRAATQSYDEGRMTPGSVAALTALALAGLLLRRLLARWTAERHLHFFVLFALLVCAAPLVFRHTGLVLLPQPGRYTIEMEAALVPLAVFGLRPLVERIRPIGRAGLCMLLIAAATMQVISHRRFAKTVLREADIAATIEYRAARWMEEHVGGSRVMLPGSMSQWTNAFARQPQFSGGSFSTTPNPVLHRALSDIYLDPGHRLPVLWLKAFGAGAIAVPGPQSPEFWKPFPNPAKFDGALEAVWREDGTTIYRVPRRHDSLAHVVARVTADGGDVAEVERYVAAMEGPEAPAAEFRWRDSNHAVVRARVPEGRLLSVQINHHPGWRALVNGKPAPLHRDGLGLMWMRPDCGGPCEVELEYDGGWELRLLRVLSVGTLGVLAVGGAWLGFRWRK